MTSYPTSQHPDRYLNIITDNLEETLREFGKKRHLCEFEIEEEKDATGKDFKLELIKYKYDDGPPMNINTEAPESEDAGTDNGGE